MNRVHLSETEVGIKLSGQLTCFNLSQLKKTGMKWLDHFSHCEVDCSGLLQINSAGMALFLAWMRYAKSQGKTLVFSKVPAVFKVMASLYALDKVLIFQDKE